MEPKTDNHWYNGTEEGWVYKGDTSSDSISGHLAIYPMIYDHIAKSDAGELICLYLEVAIPLVWWLGYDWTLSVQFITKPFIPFLVT